MGAKKRAGVSEGFQGGPKRIAILADMVDGSAPPSSPHRPDPPNYLSPTAYRSKFFDLEEEQAPVHVLSEAQTWFHFQKVGAVPASSPLRQN